MQDGAHAGRRRWWVLFLSIGVAFSVWAVSEPPASGPDEGAHMVRAAAVARGELTGPIVFRAITQMQFEVPEAYGKLADAVLLGGAPSPFVYGPQPKGDGTPNCVPSLTGGQHRVKEITYEFRGLPLVYAVIGLPTLPFPDIDGMYLMRIVQALLCAALLASAIASALGRREPRLPVLGVIVAATPEFWYLAGVTNPNAFEIAAAIALWSTLVALARGDSHEPDSRLVVRAGVALVALVAIRPLSPGFAIIALVAGAAIAWGPRATELWRRRDVRGWLIAGLVMTVINAVWVAAVALKYPGHSHGVGLVKAMSGFPHVLRQTVGIFGGDHINLPWPVYLLWALAAIAVLGIGLLACEKRDALVGLGIVVITLILSVSVNGLNIPPVSFVWQGRYGLPVAAGAVIVICGCAHESRLPRALWRTAPAVLVVALLGAQVAVFIGTGRRLGMGHVKGIDVFDYIRDPRWEPIFPPALLLIAFLAAVTVLAIVILRVMEAPSTPPALSTIADAGPDRAAAPAARD